MSNDYIRADICGMRRNLDDALSAHLSGNLEECGFCVMQALMCAAPLIAEAHGRDKWGDPLPEKRGPRLLPHDSEERRREMRTTGGQR
jgi:hypothetical protein